MSLLLAPLQTFAADAEKANTAEQPVELQIGDSAPEFETLADSGEAWKSTEHVGGKTLVVYFYPADFTSGCLKQAEQFRDNMHELVEQGVEVVGVSGDAVDSHQLFKENHVGPAMSRTTQLSMMLCATATLMTQSLLLAVDWPMFGRTPTRNPVVSTGNAPLDWNIGRFDRRTASPLVAEIGGQVQVIVPQGDGWLRSFHAQTGKLIWEFDINYKTSQWKLGGEGTRNNILATPVLYEGRIYLASGQEAEHGEDVGRLVCIDPSQTGDISSELAVDENGDGIPHRRLQAMNPEKGEKAIANPNSGLVWEFTSDGDDFVLDMHRTLSSVAVHRGLVIAVDFSGILHVLDAQTGKRHWGYDTFAQVWSSPLVVGDIVYVADADGDVAVFRLSADPRKAMKPTRGGFAFVDGEQVDLEPIAEIGIGSRVHTSPVFANDTLYISTKDTLYAISSEDMEGDEKLHADEAPRRSAATTGRNKTAETAKSRVPKAAFVPTPQDVVDKMLELAGVQADETVCDLGSGDGRIPITAATKYAAKGIGYELDRKLVAQSEQKAVAEGVADRVEFENIDLFDADLSDCDVVTLYLYPVQNRELLPRLKTLKAGARIITHEYALPRIDPEETLRIQSSDSGEAHTLYRYTVPLSTSSESGSKSPFAPRK